MREKKIFEEILSFSGVTKGETWLDSSTLLPVNFPDRRKGLAIRTFHGRVISVRDRVFTSIINDEGTEFSVNMLKDKLTQTQRNELAEGVEFSWTIRNDYSGGKKKKKDEIVFLKKAPVDREVLMRKKHEFILKYGHFFEK